MNIKYITMVTVAMAFSASASAAPPNDNPANPNGMAQPPSQGYWQAPNWSKGNAAPTYNSAPSRPETLSSETLGPETLGSETRGSAPSGNTHAPVWHNDYRPSGAPAMPNYYRPPYPSNNYPAQNYYQPEMNQPYWNGGAPPQQMQNAYRGNPYPPQRGPYPGANGYQYHPENAQSAYGHPGYGSYGHNNAWNNNRQDDQLWGNSEPHHWANPNKGNMGQGWNETSNGAGSMDEMPGGWRAPQFSTPNPVDKGDRVQGNVGDLPDQMKDRPREHN